MKDNTLVIVTAIIAIVILEIFALMQGINGTMLSIAIGVICLLAGVEAKSLINSYKPSKKEGK